MTPFERLQALARPGRIPAPPQQMAGAPGAQTAFERLLAQSAPGRVPMQGAAPQFPMQGAMPPQPAPQGMPPQQPEPLPEAPRMAQGALSGFNDPMISQGLLGLGMGLLEASGPSARPVSLGQAMSRGMGSGLGMMQQEQQNELQRRMMGLKEQQVEADNAEAAAKAEAIQAQRAAMEELMRSPAIPDAVKALGPEAVAQFAKTHATETAKPDRGTSLQKNLVAAGLEPGTPAYNRAMLDAVLKPQSTSTTTVNMPEAGPQIGTIPPGFQVTRGPDGSYRMEPIPGGPVDIDQREVAEKAEAAKASKDLARHTVVQDAGRALSLIQESGDLATGMVGAASRVVPGTPAFVLQGHIDSIGSNIGLDVLQTMRENSPTGGALGQVPIQQQQRLEAVYGNMSLAQPRQVLEDNIKRVDNIYRDLIHGTPEQIQELVGQGRITREDAAPLMERHRLSFDERGRPTAERQAAPPDPMTAPVEDILEYWSTR